jgi:putative aldouronate transport system substrate-binding protein
MKTGKLAVIALVFVLILSFTTCSNTKDEGSSERKSTVASSSDPWAEWKPIAGKEYTMTIATNVMGPVDNENGQIMKWYKEQTGLKIENINLERANYMELLNIRIASGQAPDFFMIEGHAPYHQLYDQGVLLEFDEGLLKELAPSVYELYQEEGKDNIRIVKLNPNNPNLMSGFSSFQLHSTFIYPFVWRKDWLNNVGITKTPETFAEMEDALYKFAKNDPDRNGKNDTYGISSGGLRAVFGYFGAMPGVIERDGETWLERDGKLINSGVFPEMKEALAVLAKWYADGIIDPEFITSENKGGRYDITHAFHQGRIGMSAHGHYWTWCPEIPIGLNYAEFTKTYPNDTLSRIEFAVPILSKDGVNRNTYRQNSILNSTYVFNSKLVNEKDKVGKIMEFYNWLYGNYDNYITAWYGFKGEHWDIVDGIPTPLGKYGADQANRNQIGAYTTLAAVCEPLKLQGPIRGNLVPWAERSGFGGSNIGLYTKLPTATTSTGLYSADLEKAQKETYINIITGKLPVDAFDKFVSDWYAQGGQILEDEATAWFKDFNSK